MLNCYRRYEETFRPFCIPCADDPDEYTYGVTGQPAVYVTDRSPYSANIFSRSDNFAIYSLNLALENNFTKKGVIFRRIHITAEPDTIDDRIEHRLLIDSWRRSLDEAVVDHRDTIKAKYTDLDAIWTTTINNDDGEKALEAVRVYIQEETTRIADTYL